MEPIEIAVLNTVKAAIKARSYAEGVVLLQPLLSREYAEAEFLMGEISMLDDSDIGVAMKWFWAAANRGHIRAAFQIACSPVAKDTLGIIDQVRDRMLAKAARAKVVDAYHMLALGYATGEWIGVSNRGKNPKKAFQWYLRAARGGDRDCAYEAGLMYVYGQGTERNPMIGVNWLQEAALKGHLGACQWLIDRFSRGDDGVPVDTRSAAVWQALLRYLSDAI